MSSTAMMVDVRRESRDDAAHAPEVTMPERRQEGLFQAIANCDAKHDQAHKRLRDDFRELEEKVSEGLKIVQDRREVDRREIDRIANTPTNIEKLILSPKVVVSMVIFAVVTTGGVWSANYGIRSEIAALRSDAREMKSSYDATSRMQEVQSSALKTAIDDMKRRQELQQYEIQGLKEAIITGKPRAVVR